MDKIFEKMKDNEAPRQTLLFSATLPQWVHDVAKRYMNSKKVLTVDLVEDQVTANISKYFCVHD